MSDGKPKLVVDPVDWLWPLLLIGAAVGALWTLVKIWGGLATHEHLFFVDAAFAGVFTTGFSWFGFITSRQLIVTPEGVEMNYLGGGYQHIIPISEIEVRWHGSFPSKYPWQQGYFVTNNAEYLAIRHDLEIEPEPSQIRTPNQRLNASPIWLHLKTWGEISFDGHDHDLLYAMFQDRIEYPVER